MAKKKVERRMKRQVRKTLGALFLASSVAIAAIPTGSYDGGSAAAANTGEAYIHEVDTGYHDGSNTTHSVKYGDDFLKPTGNTTLRTVYSDGSGIPLCDSDVTIYTSGDGKFRFAYVDANGHQTGADNKFAVILGYDKSTMGADGVLEIPEKVDAYLQYNDNDTSTGVYCAVGKEGNYLFYESAFVYKDSGSNVGQNYYTEEVVETYTKMRDGEKLYTVDDADGNVYPSSADGLTKAEIAAKKASGEFIATGAEKELQVTGPVKKVHVFKPCYKDTISDWVDAERLYFYPTKSWKSSITDDSDLRSELSPQKDEDGQVIPQEAFSTGEYGRIAGQPVQFIGKQYLEESVETDGTRVWKIKGTIDKTNGTSKGIFAGNGNIVNLKTSNELSGVSDYAFYGCTGMEKITLGNKLEELGNHAFDGCSALISVELSKYSNMKTIGAYCFYGCKNLKKFELSNSVSRIGDGAFRDCEGMASIDLIPLNDAGDDISNLQNLGAYVFQNCSSLPSITFPKGYKETLELSEFEGCTALKWIKSANSEFNIVDSTICNYDWQAFQNEWNGKDDDGVSTREQFYIEAPNYSAIWQTCKDNEIAFKHLDKDIFELTKHETTFEDADADKATVTYKVDNTNTLLEAIRNNNAKITSLDFPKYIGPYTIQTIGTGAFQNWCTLTEVTIGPSVTEIGESAFQGCHNLKYVYFENASTRIGDNAFLTQYCTSHSDCTTKEGKDTNNKDVKVFSSTDMQDAATKVPSVKLGFVGRGFNNVSAVIPNSTFYQYAMKYDGHYNNDGQAPSFIDFYTGWPTMLTIQYHCTSVTGKTGFSELVDFPTYNERNAYILKDYLTKEQREDADNANSAATQVFTESTQKLTIPAGVDAILDGLYYDKTQNNSITVFPVECHGLKTIETTYKTDPVSGNILYFADDSDTTGTINPDPKRDYFPRADETKSDFAGASALTEIVIDGDTTTIDPYAFQNAKGLTKVTITAPVSRLGEQDSENEKYWGHVFQGDSNLEKVTLPAGLVNMGIAPFKGCTKLTDVSFSGNQYFTCDNSIIYATSGESKTGIAEVLPGRGDSIGNTDMDTSITTVWEEAFTDNQMRDVDLTNTGIGTIPTHAFYESGIKSVYLPDSCNTIVPYAFEKSNIEVIQASNVENPRSEALDGIIVSGGETSYEKGLDAEDGGDGSNHKVIVRAPSDSALYRYAVAYDYKWEPYVAQHTVNFYQDGNSTEPAHTTKYSDGTTISQTDITLAKVNVKNSYQNELGYWYVLEGWEDESRKTYSDADLLTFAVKKDANFYGHYVARARETYTVTFLTYSGETAKTYKIQEGDTLEDEQLEPPVLGDVTDNGVTLAFGGWNKSGDVSVTDPVTSNVTFTPIYRPKTTDNITYTVSFRYYDPVSGKVVSWNTISDIVSGTDISKNVSAPTIEGYTFDGWAKATATPDTGDITNVTCDFEVMGTFTKNGSSGTSGDTSGGDTSGGDSQGGDNKKPGGGSNETVEINGFKIPSYDTKIFAVALYYDKNGDPYAYRLVNIGEKAPDIAKPEGYVTGYKWSPTPTETTVTDVSFFNLVPGTTSSGSSSGGNSGDTSSGGSSTSSTAKFYTLTVVNGSGSGSYIEGAQVVISANTPASGQEFSSWTIEPSTASIASKAMSATVVTMPKESVTVTALYKAASGSSTTSGTSNSNNSSGKPNSNSGSVSSGTTVVIDKNGLSNTGVVSATVKGSSDNFTIKVTESTDAAEAVVKALQAEYGDISGIKYFPMDISLYDSTGTKKVTDTTGLSISITLPIPDALTTYAGNNKIAGVVNNRLDKLSPKFTTIDGVACMTFTAEHFSPYVIYVDTDHLSASVISDNTPKTGDGIHPKWFLSLGLAGIAGVLFMKRDKKTTRKVKTA